MRPKNVVAAEDATSVSRRGMVQHKTNPFVSSGLVGVKTKRLTNQKGDMMVVSQKTSEVVAEVAGFWHTQEVDNTKFVKLYVNGVKAFKELTGAGTKVFEVLYLEVQKNVGKDLIWLSFSEVDQSITPMAKATFMRGMREMIEKGFIAESTTQSKYFLNPDYMWNGDRLAFVRAYYRSPNQLSVVQGMEQLTQPEAPKGTGEASKPKVENG